MSSDEIHASDIGTTFEVTLKDGTSIVDISAATIKQIVFKKPDKTVDIKTADFVTDGSDGKIQYVTVDGDLSPVGQWQIQAHIVLPSGTWRSDVASFIVHDNL